MRLIDADALKAQIDQEVKEDKVLDGWAFFFKVYLDEAPTIDAVPNTHIIPTITVTDSPMVEYAPVEHGEWISEYDGFEWDVRCSVCGEEALIKEGGSHDHAYSNFCPNCGAVMNGEEQA